MEVMVAGPAVVIGESSTRKFPCPYERQVVLLVVKRTAACAAFIPVSVNVKERKSPTKILDFKVLAKSIETILIAIPLSW
jgi:hypothetical protein